MIPLSAQPLDHLTHIDLIRLGLLIKPLANLARDDNRPLSCHTARIASGRYIRA